MTITAEQQSRLSELDNIFAGLSEKVKQNAEGIASLIRTGYPADDAVARTKVYSNLGRTPWNLAVEIGTEQ